jgi:hypothetical protein
MKNQETQTAKEQRQALKLAKELTSYYKNLNEIAFKRIGSGSTEACQLLELANEQKEKVDLFIEMNGIKKTQRGRLYN